MTRLTGVEGLKSHTKRNRLPVAREKELDVEWVPQLDDLIRRSDFVCTTRDYNPGYWNETYIDDNAPSEPWVPQELCKLDNVILAPHNGGANWDVRGGKGVMVARAMVEMMRGGRPSPLNLEIYAAT